MIETDKRTFFSIGHSNRSIEDFVKLLLDNGIETLIDVRSFPHSRHVPWFNIEDLPEYIYPIKYEWIQKLGGRRPDNKNSPNTYWNVKGFRSYADYCLTDEFEEGFQQLISHTERCAYMCAEEVWWRCHRRIITDYLISRGYNVTHIMSSCNSIGSLTKNCTIKTKDKKLIYLPECKVKFL